MKARLGECSICGGSSILDNRYKGEKIRCLFCKATMPLIYEDDPDEEILTKEINVGKGYGWNLIGVQEQEERAIETGEDEEILFYVPYEVFIKSDRAIKRFVDKNID